MHDVRVVRSPERRRRPAQLFRHLFALQHRAVAHVPGGRRLAVADDALAHHRAAAVGADQRGALDFAFCAVDDHLALVGMKAGHPRIRAQLDQVALRLAAIEQRAVDVGAVRHRVGIAEALGEARIERDVDHLLAGHAVHHQQALDEHRFLLHELADAERIERVPGVGRELDAGADLAELGRLLEDDGFEALAREAERHGEAADAAAGDDDGLRVSRGGWRCHRVHLRS